VPQLLPCFYAFRFHRSCCMENFHCLSVPFLRLLSLFPFDKFWIYDYPYSLIWSHPPKAHLKPTEFWYRFQKLRFIAASFKFDMGAGLYESRQYRILITYLAILVADVCVAQSWRERKVWYCSKAEASVVLQDNSPTNHLAVSQFADWITRGLVNSWNYNTLFAH